MNSISINLWEVYVDSAGGYCSYCFIRFFFLYLFHIYCPDPIIQVFLTTPSVLPVEPNVVGVAEHGFVCTP